ncbi:ABC transporter permease [Luteithermobacter gelatinilyticus]|uniref:ABC transporter permease n=1 Tax=Luteithermobacter gelatinilyticus TaxID=2582913 RepID=UPI001105FDBB|nr:ABC transporter permease [Luteithermobacter gelatinilyticus]
MGKRWSNIFHLGIKELYGLRTDPVLMVLIVYVFSYAVYAVATGAKFEVENAAVAIVDEDRSELSRQIGAALLPPFFKTPDYIDSRQMEAVLDQGKYVFVLDIPPEFEADLLAGRRPALQINVDATAMTQAGNGAVYLQNIIMQEAVKYATGQEKAAPLPVDLVIRAKFNPNFRSVNFNAIMQIINNITILAIILTGAALIREREHGTVEHLLVMPVVPTEIMLAKIWANGLVIIAGAILSLWLVAHELLEVPIAGSVPLFIVGAVLYLFSVTALGILLATFTGSMPQFGLLVIPVLVMMYLLSGSTTPLESMPVWLQNVMQLSPSTHFVAFSQAILYRGAGLDIVWPDLLAIIGISGVYFLISLARFRKAIASFH